MRHDVLYRPSYAMLRLILSPGERVIAEAGAMVGMSPDMRVTTLLNPGQESAKGLWGRLTAFVWGLFFALLRTIFGGERLFVNRFQPGASGGELLLAPTLPGDIAHRVLSGESLRLKAGAYLASSPSIRVRLRLGGLRGLLSGNGLFFLDLSGTGDVWFNAYGGIEELEVSDGLTVDTGHLVAFDPALSWSVTAVGGIKSTLLSGEGLVLRFVGKGRVWVQSRNLDGLARWIGPMLPK